MASVKAEQAKAGSEGFWPSVFSAAHATGGMREFGQICCSKDSLFWVRYCPVSGRNLVMSHQQGTVCDITPEPYSVRSRVHEYGGGALLLCDQQLAFVNDDDQQIYLQSLDGAVIRQLTFAVDIRFGDLQYDRTHDRIVAIAEDHNGASVENSLVAINLQSGEWSYLHQGHDFYASPAISPDGEKLSWVCWDHPDMPWFSSFCIEAELDAKGGVSETRVAWQKASYSCSQPQYSESGKLHLIHEATGFWELHRLGMSTDPLAEFGADCAVPQWQLGQSSYCFVGEQWLAISAVRQAAGELWLIDRRNGQRKRLAASYSAFRSLASDGRYLYCVASHSSKLSSVLRIDPLNGMIQLLDGGERLLPLDQVSVAEAFTFSVGDQDCHSWLYRPNGSGEDKLPLVVIAHGGPTATAYAEFKPLVQYWTQRGFAVLDLNYRGSAGFGREYRRQLFRLWGRADVNDAVAAVDALTAEGIVNPDQVFIRGHSAGGYLALCALTYSDRFSGGTSLYGISDPLVLTQNTHKFESRYMDWLIGHPERDAERYRARTPLLDAGKINAPVLLFQGGQDKVVLPEQTRKIADQLREQGNDVEFHLFPTEGHGFRQSCHQQQVLEQELAFYQRIIRQGKVRRAYLSVAEPAQQLA